MLLQQLEATYLLAFVSSCLMAQGVALLESIAAAMRAHSARAHVQRRAKDALEAIFTNAKEVGLRLKALRLLRRGPIKLHDN